MRALQNYAGRGVRHFGGLSSHYSRYRLSGVFIAYDEHIAFKNSFFIVYGRNLLIVFGPSYDEPASVYLGDVERVKRLPGLEHNVIRNVNHVINRPYARRLKPFQEPRRRRGDFNSLYDPERVSVAKRSILYANLNPVACFKPT